MIRSLVLSLTASLVAPSRCGRAARKYSQWVGRKLWHDVHHACLFSTGWIRDSIAMTEVMIRLSWKARHNFHPCCRYGTRRQFCEELYVMTYSTRRSLLMNRKYVENTEQRSHRGRGMAEPHGNQMRG